MAAGLTQTPPTTSTLSITGSQTYTIPIQANPPIYYTPQQIEQAYGINNVIFSGGIIGNGAGPDDRYYQPGR